MPVYPHAKAARVTGEVSVRVTVEDGLVVPADVMSKAFGQRFLETPTVENLKTWRFAADVSRTFTVTCTYEVSGKESDDLLDPGVEMLPFLDVTITARPVKPTACMSSRTAIEAWILQRRILLRTARLVKP